MSDYICPKSGKCYVIKELNKLALKDVSSAEEASRGLLAGCEACRTGYLDPNTLTVIQPLRQAYPLSV
jgi:hypothetical protein